MLLLNQVAVTRVAATYVLIIKKKPAIMAGFPQNG